MLDINVAQILIAFIVLLFSLTVHETAHAWTADRLGDPTARLLGRVSLNPVVHIDPIGTILLPLLAAWSGLPIIGWAKPVPVNLNRLGHGRCAMKNTFQAFAGQVNFGLMTYAKVQKSCAGACFTSCVYSDFPGNSGIAGCGPEPACGAPNSGCRDGGNVVVPMLVDNYYSSPPNLANISELLKWVETKMAPWRHFEFKD